MRTNRGSTVYAKLFKDLSLGAKSSFLQSFPKSIALGNGAWVGFASISFPVSLQLLLLTLQKSATEYQDCQETLFSRNAMYDKHFVTKHTDPESYRLVQKVQNQSCS